MLALSLASSGIITLLLILPLPLKGQGAGSGVTSSESTEMKLLQDAQALVTTARAAKRSKEQGDKVKFEDPDFPSSGKPIDSVIFYHSDADRVATNAYKNVLGDQYKNVLGDQYKNVLGDLYINVL